MRLGAGAGTWTSADYFKSLADLPELDYLDLHIYPIQYGLRVRPGGEGGRDRTGQGQGYLHRRGVALQGRRPRAAHDLPVEAFARDAFAFWQPLDQDFIRLVVNLARRIDAEFCSFFWMKYLYGYLPLHAARPARMSAAELMQASDRAAAANILRRDGSARPGSGLRSLINPLTGIVSCPG